ncbi:alpha/beta hydrolase [Streptacidiphilus jiangxiensis]|uniref:Dienelactone hydrolase n=1 Tax=Streptacidiphilus jiangxiensis TaxID=235985 RepID=A0A1H7UP67_STRJI|nr:alpha/beta hydrolase [Streptacidiphilus jiangxiensis]SEL98574.1 Dienelactone hydrolase [Streptacidiphilus jiangxiensis]
MSTKLSSLARCALAGCVVLLFGCAAGTVGSTPRAPTASRLPCGATASPGAAAVRALTLRTADGVRLAALEAGSGPRGVVLVPESGGRGKCGWLPYAGVLAGLGYRVLLFDGRCQGESDCPASGGDPDADVAAALAALRRAGATREALLGASAGGAEALSFAARPFPGLRAVAALSPDELDRPLHVASAVRLPVWTAVAQDDPFVAVPDLRRLLAALGTPAPLRSLTVLPPGSGHGWDLLTDPAPRSLRTALAAFLARSLR